MEFLSVKSERQYFQWYHPTFSFSDGCRHHMKISTFIQYMAWIDPNTVYVVCISICSGFALCGIHIPLCSLYGIHMPLFPYMVIQHIVLGMALLWAAMDSPLPKDLYCDITMIWPLLFHEICTDVSKTPNNALTMWMHGDYRLSIDKFFVGFDAICYIFLWNNPIYIEGRNCRLSTIPGLLNKCSGTLSSRWLGWWSHVCVGKPFLVNHCIYDFKASLLLCQLYVCTG